ncbi:MAG: hypothetical protein PHH59_03670 [Methylovulum sp.]|nr:hypothetical protein [Methylovulum sp.]MDD2723106.1 hypothetical protein [Methylovulum sp.]
MFTVTKPVIANTLKTKLIAPYNAKAGNTFSYKLSIGNNTGYALNGTQAVLTLPEHAELVSKLGDAAVQVGKTVIITLGRLDTDAVRNVQVDVKIPAIPNGNAKVAASALIRSATAMPVSSNQVLTKISN